MLGGLNFKELWQKFPQYVETWLQEYGFVVIESILSKA